MMLSDEYNVFGDFLDKDFLNEYFNCKNIIVDHLPDMANVISHLPDTQDASLIDIIKHRANKNKKIILIISLHTLKRLLTEKSQYNNFDNEVEQQKIKIIINHRFDNLLHDPLHLAYELMLMFYFQDFYTKNGVALQKATLNIELVSRMKEIKLDFLADGVPGKELQKTFNNWTFIPTSNHYLSFTAGFYGLFHIIGPGLKKDKTFLCLTSLQNNFRYHRKWLWEIMENKEYLKNSITKITTSNKEKPTFKDLHGYYGDSYLEHTGGDSKTKFDNIPSPEYYRRTYFEIVCETIGQHPTDDTFFFTEKTIKPILMKHPFIVMGPKNYLMHLRALGFNTFEGLIDESYDQLDDAKLRAKAISNLLEQLDLENSKKFYEQSREICEHNQRHLLNLAGRHKFDLWKNFEQFFKSHS